MNSAYAHSVVKDLKLANTLSGSCEMLFQERSLCSGRRLERETTQEPTTVLFVNVMMQLRMSSHYAEQLNHWIHIINRDAEGAVKCS